MTTTHTPGPWTLETVRTVSGFCHKVGPFPARREGGDPRHACLYSDYPSESNPADQELLANARLIAAAPDYHDAAGWILSAVATNAAPVNPLAALHEMALDGKHVTLDAGLVLDLLKAHAKAKGEQQ
ncbi:hypothetical protein ACDY99_23880 [Achromobacter dolens]|uniref:hypothetical protein n=1 Tax=Achromobacter dolens TaxID=1287738 RepID=UPI003556BBEC